MSAPSVRPCLLWILVPMVLTIHTAAQESRAKVASGSGLPAEQSLQNLIPQADLEIDLVRSEPAIKQPSFLRFDERGRMWVVEYRQYPAPAGVSIQSKDRWWRAIYDKVPAPPGHPDNVPGEDRITIHQDTNGDGHFDHSKIFLDGLNLATGLAWDRDGIWVLQPPYLLYYRDSDRDDRVDGPPDVHLSGFGIEDTHSIANSLRWGPDGWLYGAQGSTVSAAITVRGKNSAPLKSVGQLMWRYHPHKREYEIFSEGGGNIWSCQFDAAGRLYAGANEGGKLGYHYMQGSYNKKNFPKHGDLSNPYAYDYFLGILEPTSQRVTTNLMVYEETALPSRYHGAMMTANPLLGRVLASRLVPQGPTFHSELIDMTVDSVDRWFRPVYLESGPDGALYVADWYDQQITHTENYKGHISVKDGRIYRIRARGAYTPPDIDLAQLSSDQLAETLQDKRRWYRDTARRLIKDRQDKSVLPKMRTWLNKETGQVALEALWILNLLGEFGSDERLIALQHNNPQVRKWAIRLIGDERRASTAEAAILKNLATSDSSIEVRQQLASTAKRLQSPAGLAVIHALMKRDEDAQDPYMPSMVWWALESYVSSDPLQIVGLFESSQLFESAMVQNSLLAYTMRRLASQGSRRYLRACANLLSLAPDTYSKKVLLAGFEDAYRGRSMVGLPEELLTELDLAGGGSLALQIRQKIPEAIEKAKKHLSDPLADASERQRIVEALGEVPQPTLLPNLLALLKNDDKNTVRNTLTALRIYDDQRVGKEVSALYPKFDDTVRPSAMTLLTSRPSWALTWMQAVHSGKIRKNLIPPDAISSLRYLNNQTLNSLLDDLWDDQPRSTTELDQEKDRIRNLVVHKSIEPDPYNGREIYSQRCGACHKLHDSGGAVGPDLTGYQRQDLESLIRAILDPNAEIREGFENKILTTKDGQTLSGFITDKDDHVIVLKPIGGQPLVTELSNIASIQDVGTSLMPPG